MRLKDCHSFLDFRELARRRLPSPIFNYIDGAADDESTYNRNTKSFEDCDLIPNVLRGVQDIDLSVEVLGQKLELPIYCSPTALQRFSIPFKLSLNGIFQFAVKPMWALNYLTHEKFSLPQLDDHVDMSDGPISIGRYFTEMLDPCLNWDDVAKMVEYWDGQFCLKGVMSVEDAKKAVDIGCTGIVISNHGGRQLDGSRSPFDQLSEIVDAVGDDIDVIMDSGIQRGTHVLKALSIGAKAVGGGRFYLFALAAAGQHGVERALELMKLEIERDMRLMGVCSISELNRENLRFR
jgi:L-lactate dehydrogenase (cytochrome)